MATYVNDLRLKEIATGDEAGTWGTSTNTNLELIGEALGYGTQDCFASDADATTTVADGASDPARAMYFKVTSSATLTATRTLTIAPNTISRVMLIENATTGSQSITISQGSGSTVTIASGAVKMVYLDGAGAGGAVVEALADLELPTVTVADLTATTADINAGTIDGTVIGGSTAAAGTFTTGQFNTSLNVDGTTNLDVVDIDGAVDMASTLTVGGTTNDGTTLVQIAQSGTGRAFSVNRNVASATRAVVNLAQLQASGGAEAVLDIQQTTPASRAIKVTPDGSIDRFSVYGTGALVTTPVAGGHAVFNEGGVDADFRVESDTNTHALFVEGSSSNVGIGTSSLTEKLTVVGTTKVGEGVASNTSKLMVNTASGTAAGIQLFQDGVESWIIQNPASTTALTFANSGSERLRITATGNVGIGTTTPAAPLSFGSITNDARIYLRGNTNEFAIGTNGLQTVYAGYQGHVFQTGSFGGAEAMRIDSSGRVGISNSSPSNYTGAGARTLVVGSNSSASDPHGITVVGGSSSTSNLAFTDNAGDGSANDYRGLFQYYHPDDSLRVFVASTERMRIDASGNVGIGTSSPTGKFHVVGGRSNFAPNSENFAVYLQYNSATSGFYVGSPSADAMAFSASSGAERMRIDSSGNLMVGTTSAFGTTGTTINAAGLVYSSADGDRSGQFDRTGVSDGEIVRFTKAGTTVGSIGTSASSIYIGGTSNGAIYFNGTTDVRPWNTSTQSNLDNTMDLGTSAARFKDIYATNGTIQTSDRNEKQDIEVLSEAEQRVAVACKGLLRKFRWKDAVEEKGDDARIHFGIIAQDLQAAFEAEGLDAGRYAMFISSTWTEEKTGEERSRMGVRYSELLAFIIAAI